MKIKFVVGIILLLSGTWSGSVSGQTLKIETYAGSPGVAGSVDGPRIEALLSSPTRIAIDADGTAYFTETLNHTIRRISPEGYVSLSGGKFDTSGSQDGPIEDARFFHPAGIAIGPPGSPFQGSIFVADQGNFVIRRIDPDGLVSTWAGTPGQSGYVDGPAAAARFVMPLDLEFDDAGHLYVSDRCAIRRISTDGVVSTWAGQLTCLHGDVEEGPRSAVKLGVVSGLAFDQQRNLYASQPNENVIRRFEPDPGEVSTVIGSGIRGWADGTWQDARMSGPVSLARHPSGSIYYVEHFNYVVREIVSGGTIRTVAGSPGIHGFSDGVGSMAIFSDAFGLDVAPDGSLLITDGNHVIRRATIMIDGDANGDGVLSVADIFAMIHYVFSNGAFPPGAADLDYDGKILVNDIFMLIHKIFSGP